MWNRFWLRFPACDQIHFLDTSSRVGLTSVNIPLDIHFQRDLRTSGERDICQGKKQGRDVSGKAPPCGKSQCALMCWFIMQQGAIFSVSSGHCRCSWLPASKSCCRAIINSLWGIGGNCLLWIQKGTEKLLMSRHGFFLDTVSTFENDYCLRCYTS